MIYDEYYENPESKESLSITMLLINHGLFSRHNGIRVIFRDAIKYIADSIRLKTLSELPYIFFLKLLLKSDPNSRAKDSKQYF